MKALFLVPAILAVGAGTLLADITHNTPGAVCVATSGSLVNSVDGQSANLTTSTASAVCPIDRDIAPTLSTKVAATVWVLDENPSTDVCCTLHSKNPGGGVVNGIQTFVPRMIDRGKGGHIVNTASMSAFVALKGTGLYCTTKMAVRGLTECLALDLAEHGIGVSLLCPGAVNSNIHESVLSRPAHLSNTGYYGADPAMFAHLKRVIEVGMEPETLARYVLDGVEKDQFYILPYPEFRGTLEDIHGQVMAALARPEDDPDYEKRVAHGVPGGERRPAEA